MGTDQTHWTQDEAQLERLFFWITAGLMAIGWGVYLQLYGGWVSDWWASFHPIGEFWRSPYTVGIHFAYPPWMALLLAPFNGLPIQLGRAVLGSVTTLMCAFTIRQLDGKLAHLLCVTFSAPFGATIISGQTDAFPIFGLGLLLMSSAAAQGIGLFLLLSKPTILLFAAPVVWWHSERRLLLPAIGIGGVLLSFLIWGFWVQPMLDMSDTLWRGRDMSVFPWGTPIGLALLGYSVFTNRPKLGALSTYFFAPYLQFYSLLGYLLVGLCLLPQRWAIVAFVLSWALFFAANFQSPFGI